MIAKPHMLGGAMRSLAPCTIVAAVLAAVAASADPRVISAPLCGVLKGVGAKTHGYTPEAARAQLVMSLAAAFDRDAAKLKEVRAHIDDATMIKCPKERAAMLEVTKTRTLTEAIE